MSEDARGVKGRIRVLYVANPSSDSGDSEEDRRAHLRAPPVYDHTPLHRHRSPPAQHYHHHPPTPLTTSLPANHALYQHPSTSSPSSTSSPAADESTPPSSTPGLAVPDLAGDTPSPRDLSITATTADEHVADGAQVPPSRGGKFLQTIKSSFQNHRHPRPPPDNPKRPRTVGIPSSVALPIFSCGVKSPTSAPDSATGISSKVLIVVTTDSDWYVTVDISGAKSASVVRECIFNKVSHVFILFSPSEPRPPA